MIGTFFLRLSATGLSFLTSILLARLLGAEEYGVYAYVMALITLLGIPATLGLPNLVLRQVAAYHTQSSWALMRGILQWANKFVALNSVGLIIGAGFLAWGMGDHYNTNVLHTFWVALIFLLPIKALSALRANTLRGLHHVILGQLPETIFRPGLFVLLLSIAYLYFNEERTSSLLVMELHAATATLAFLAGAWLLWKRLPEGVRNTSPKYDSRIWFKSALAFLFLGGLQIMSNQLAILMLGPIEGAESVGIYRVAARSATLVTLVLTAVNMTLAPTISTLYAANQLERMQRIVTASARITFGLSLPIALIMIIYSRLILETIFGVEFVDGTAALAILCGGQMINAGMGSVGLLLNMTGHEKDTAKGFTLAALLNVILNALLIPKWGIEGAAIATTTSVITWNLLLAIWSYKRIGIHSTALGKFL